MSKQNTQKAQKSTKAQKAPEKRGMVTPARVGLAIANSSKSKLRQRALHARNGNITQMATEITIGAEQISVKTSEIARVEKGRISEYAEPKLIGEASVATKDVATREDALYKLPKLASRYAKLARLSREGDAEAKEKAKRILESARGLCKLHGIDINAYEKFNESLDPVPTEQPAANKPKGKGKSKKAA